MKLKTFMFIYIVSLINLLIAGFFNITGMNIVFKAITSILFIILPFIALKKDKHSKYFKNMIVGLVLACIGDILLVIDKNKGIGFIIGVASFAAAHIAYIKAFFNFKKFNINNIIISFAIFIPLAIIINATKWFNFEGLQIVINIYGLIISFMVAKSLDLKNFYVENKFFVIITITSAILFLISDFILLFAYFGIGCDPRLEVLNNFIYYIGQCLFGLSFIKELKNNE